MTAALLDDRIRPAVESAFPGQPFQVVTLPAQASNRTYHRVTLGDGRTAVAMAIAPDQLFKSEEAVAAESKAGELPFLNVQRYLASGGIAVPKVFATALEQGIVLLEDLGDVQLEQVVRDAGETVRRIWYERAITELAKMHDHAANHPDPGCLAFARRFERSLLEWELWHFVEFGIEGRFKKKLDEGEAAFLKQRFAEIAARVDALPKGFVHRDYQSRNLMVVGDALRVIDFQDALTGPAVYDLVALLRDSYVVLSPATIDHLLAHYVAERKKRGTEVKLAELRSAFDITTLQRKLKDSGRFDFIDQVKNNPSFLPCIPASLGYVRAAFARLPEYEDVRRVLAKHQAQLS